MEHVVTLFQVYDGHLQLLEGPAEKGGWGKESEALGSIRGPELFGMN